jgi:acyl carrier protein
MSDTVVRSKVRSFITQRFPAVTSRTMPDDASLLSSGAIDSLGILDLATYIGSEFGIELEDDDLNADNFDSIDSITRFLQEKRAA